MASAKGAESRQRESTDSYFAAVDLGSNSFHMIVARYSLGQLLVVDRLREMVQLRMGLDKRGRLSLEFRERALECLSRFGERLRDIPPSQLRVVGTNTLRELRDKGAFLTDAEAVLGHSIDVISGIEEARLVYLGALTSMPLEDSRSLVVDIGGGSTELIVGHGSNPVSLESLEIGCVSFSKKYFSGGKLSGWRFGRARIAARLELRGITGKFGRDEWTDAIGTSGTAQSLYALLQELDPTVQGISHSGLKQLTDHFVKSKDVSQLGFAALPPERARVLPGGLAILLEVFNQFDIDNMGVAEGSLREGILYDLIGRYSDEDARVSSVRAMAARYHVDEQQAQRVTETALRLFDQVAEELDLNSQEYRKLLEWAAMLHEVGLDIAHSRYHAHGAYLLQNSDMPGFTRREQLVLGALVAQHRRKLRPQKLKELPKAQQGAVVWLIVVLRLAVLLNRSRSNESLPLVSIKPTHDGLMFTCPKGWLRNNPLSGTDLREERRYLKGHVDLQVKSCSS
jgi:exopolyphosphatase/guanosine-5'-triphosphate,3'-diphosphate pyrophosphatase